MKKLKHIFEYIILKSTMLFLKPFGVDRSANISSYVARKIGPYFSYDTKARTNIKNAYKGENIDIETLMDDLWDSFGRYIGEFPFINSLSDKELDKRVNIIGLEKIKNLQDNNQPFLLCLCHQGNWDFLISKIKDIYPKFSIVYMKPTNPYVDKDLLSNRDKAFNVNMIAKGMSGSKELVKAIKNKDSIAMLVDQRMKEGISVPFFGMPAMTASAIAKLSLKYNYPIIPTQIIRKGRSSYFDIVIHPALEYQPKGDSKKDSYNIMCIINDMLEKWIRERPSQWLWFHNRWTERPKK